MSSQVLAGELAAISSESKRKFPDIRTAADKSIQELKGLPSTSEQQVAADLSRRPLFIDPFIQAALSKNVRLANSAIVCLQRLVIIKGLPRSRLHEVLEAFSACTALSLDVQLKILQSLPALVQHYSEDLKGDLIASALHVSAVLQNVKVATVSAVAAATLQQLVVSVFDKVAAEDSASDRSDLGPVHQLQIENRSVSVHEAAWDAYRVLQDLLLASEGEKTEFLRLPNFSQNLGLELVYAAFNTYPAVFASHPELIQLFKDLLAPLLIRLLSDKQGFALSLRAMRLVAPIIQRHVQQMPDECEIIIGLLSHLLDPESSPSWKRIMVMEVLKSIYANPGLIFTLCILYDADETRKPLVRENISAFVRLSTEKPALIGLGPQSSVPTRRAPEEESVIDTAALEATGGFAGPIHVATVAELDVPGLSSLWSIPKVPILDLLDKTEAPPLPETYLYTLTLECLNSLADNLAKVVLPLTINQAAAGKRKPRSGTVTAEEHENGTTTDRPAGAPTRVKRALSYRSSNMPVNPLTLEHSSSFPKIKAIASLIDNSWPALLATSSTFLYSALDNDYYRALIRSIQKFTQVAGLLALFTARDAFLTTLGKAAVPPNLIGSLSVSGPQSPGPKSPVSSRSKSLLSINSAVTNQSNDTLPAQRPSVTEGPPVLSTRNMLCLRALINLAIALGPTMHESFRIILGTLQEADLYLDHIRQINATSTLTALGQEIEAVAAATRRLLESTVDYPNDSFKHILEAFCRSLDNDVMEHAALQSQEFEEQSTSFNDFISRASGISAVQADSQLYVQDRSIILSKLGLLTDLNIARFSTYDSETSHWHSLLDCLTKVTAAPCFPKSVAVSAADIVCRSAVALMQASISGNQEEHESVQMLALTSLRQLIKAVLQNDETPDSSRIPIFCRALEAIRSILEIAGESLQVGWDIVLESVSFAIAPVDNGPVVDGLAGISASPQSLRAAFTVIQLICADFLQSLSPPSTIKVIDILYKFACQELDLNISLTSVTLFSEASNFLLRHDALSGLGSIPDLKPREDPQELCGSLRRSGANSRAAQWIILLFQLSEVAADDRGEIRNAAFQTLLRIVSQQSLDSPAMQLIYNCILLKCLTDVATQMKDVQSGRTGGREIPQAVLDLGSKSVLQGLATYISQNINIFETASHFDDNWDNLLSAMKDLLSCGSHTVNQAVYAALATVLSSLTRLHGRWQKAVSLVEDIWALNIPASPKTATTQDFQQEAFLAYIDCAGQIIRLASADMTAAQIRKISTNVVLCAHRSMPSKYGNDENSMTKLQKQILALLKSLRADIEDSNIALVGSASTLIRLPFESARSEIGQQNKKRPSYVAFSKAGMDWLSELIHAHSNEKLLYTSNAVAISLESLALPMKIKYHWSRIGSPPAPWKKATSTALEIIAPILSMISAQSDSMAQDVALRIWTALVDIASSVVIGDYSPLQISSNQGLVQAIEDDERLDTMSFLALRAMLSSHLGSSSLDDKIRDKYCSALFSASVIHFPRSSDFSSTTLSPLGGLFSKQSPSLQDEAPSRREDLAFLCLAELISMSSIEAQPFDWHKSTTFTSAYEPGDYGARNSESRRNLARAAVPWLIARFALSLKAYIADQPLRGASRIPISMAQELTWILDRMAALRCEPTALDNISLGAEQEKGSSLALASARGKERMHIVLLHTLLIQAVGVAGHPRHGDAGILQALMRVLSQ